MTKSVIIIFYRKDPSMKKSGAEWTSYIKYQYQPNLTQPVKRSGLNILPILNCAE